MDKNSNVFTVVDGELFTPKAEYVLAGVSRQVIFELAGKLGLRVREADLSLYDASIADEMFITSTSLCMVGARSFNGYPVGSGDGPGPITTRLMEAYKEEVGMDFVAQYLAHLSD